MIPILLIAAAVIGVTAGVSLTAMFWEDIKQFLKDTLEEIKRLADRFVKGCKVFLRKVKRSFVIWKYRGDFIYNSVKRLRLI